MDEVYDLKQSHKYTGLSIERLRQMINAGQLAAIQPGGWHGKIFVPKSELDRLRRPIGSAGEQKE